MEIDQKKIDSLRALDDRAFRIRAEQIAEALGMKAKGTSLSDAEVIKLRLMLGNLTAESIGALVSSLGASRAEAIKQALDGIGGEQSGR